MFEGVRARYYAVRRRVHRFERREVGDFRRWIEHTSNLIHLSVLVLVPLLIGIVTWLSDTAAQLSFLLFPPLVSGAYMLFADPQGRYASPWKFVLGLTVGAVCGWAALEVSARFIYHVPSSAFQIAPAGAALGVFLTGVAVWVLDVEQPSAFSTALLVLVTNTTQFEYVVAVAVSSSIVAGAFVAWREWFFEQRAVYLYQSVKGDDHVLVPIDGDTPETTAMFGARLAAAHRAGKVVLLKTVDKAHIDGTGRRLHGSDFDGAPIAVTGKSAEGVHREVGDGNVGDGELDETELERIRTIENRIEADAGIPCDVAIAAATTSPAETVVRTARETGCDLIVTPYEEGQDGLSSHVRRLFRGDIDVVAFRSSGEMTRWNRVLVPVRGAGDVAHSMLDFARRLAGDEGWVSVCSCVSRDAERRTAERMLDHLVETVQCPCETHVARATIEEYLAAKAPEYDLVIMGASTDRSTASRLLSPPTFRRIQGLDCDVAVVHNG